MKSIVSTILALGFLTAVSAVQVSYEGKSQAPTSCKKIADIKQGSIASASSKSIVEKAMIEEAKLHGANHVNIKFSVMKHPKLGKKYFATGVASVCN